MKFKIRTKILALVSFVILVVFGATTAIYIQDARNHYLQAIKWRADALAQSFLNAIDKMGKYVEFDEKNVKGLWGGLTGQCEQLYELNKDKNVTHIAILDRTGTIIAHSDRTLLNQMVSQTLQSEMGWRKTQMVLDQEIYHFLVPIISKEDQFVGAIDIGFPKQAIDATLNDLLYRSISLFVVLLALSWGVISFAIHLIVIRPINYLVTIGERLAKGHVIHTLEMASRGDELSMVGTVFTRISDYLREITEIAERVATGVLTHDVRRRSKRDALGQALQEMLDYLQSVATVTSKIAGGDLTVEVSLRSDIDAFGRAMRTMIVGVQSLIKQIRSSAEQIEMTGSTLSSLANRDMNIVQNAQTSVEKMVTAMNVTGTSVEEVAHNMDLLSSSAEETSASMSVMTTSITNIASNTADLAQQSQKTILALNSANQTLEHITQKTEVSRQLSQETMQDTSEGQQAVEEVTSSMDTIQQTNQSTVETITRFAQQTQDIGTILDVIEEITEQSTLLALNASIIAAQAGSHGKGFAVIAGEMKSLADKVSASTKNIAAIVRVVQQETETVVQKIHKGTRDIEQGVQRTQQAQKTLKKINNSAQRSSTVVSQIADAVKQLQRVTGEDMRMAMEQVDTMAAEITKATDEQKSSTIQINQAIGHIREMALQTQEATTQQLQGVQQVLNAANQVKTLTKQNIESSREIDETSADLSIQSQILMQAVDRFKLNPHQQEETQQALDSLEHNDEE